MNYRDGLVSTIIPVYNRPGLLAEAVNCVLAQTYRPIEIVIVDDGSTDETATIAQAFAERHPDVVQVIRQSNQGVERATNAALAVVRGEFIQFLDSDDLLMPEKFALQVAGLRANPDCDISYCFAREYVLGGHWSGRPSRRTGETLTSLFPIILAGRIWPSPAPLYRRDLIDANGPICNSRIYHDWEYECRSAAKGVRLHHCPQFLADLRGAHSREGRRKGDIPHDRLGDYADVLECILGHARHANVSALHVDLFSRRLFAAARLCANAGFEPEARRCLGLARSAALPARRRRIAVYAVISDRLGWAQVGRWCERAERSPLVTAARAARRWPAAFYARWRHRVRVALATIAGQPPSEWGPLLATRWSERQSRRRLVQ